ncbi:MAG: heavy metal translocating P-type ATPase [Candidatus Micrarchaeaceae archaeon]
MPTDPVCGMFVEQSEETLHATVRGVTYYFCSESCMNTFLSPEIELKHIKEMVIISIALTTPIIVLSYVSVRSIMISWLLLILATPVQFIIGWRFYKGTLNAIRMHSSNMDMLIAIGTSAAYLYSLYGVIFNPLSADLYFDTSAAIITLILFGRLLEYMVRSKATESVSKLMQLQPRTATIVYDDGAQKEIPIEKVQPGDILLVKPGEKIPTDGKIVEGSSFLDESSVTGEGSPVSKSVGDIVIGGTIVKDGVLKVKATKVGADTVLAKIIRVVQEAQMSKSPIERLANIISKYFVPIVVSVALISFALWLVIAHEPFGFALTVAIAVLIIACPCALGLATPAAIVVGVGRGAENGILIKGGEHLEKMHKVDTIVFDKTGTLTTGEPTVTDILSFDQRLSSNDILMLAAIAEKNSTHPLANAVLREATTKLGDRIPNPHTFTYIPGQGIKANYDGKSIIIGNHKLFDSEKIQIINEKIESITSQGKTPILVALDNKLVGLIAVADMPKPSAFDAIKTLQSMGIRVIMLTGDDEMTAKAIANQLGITKYIANVLPDEKAKVIKQLQEEGMVVAMVGDGINDAPALAQADIGIAIGSGSDIAVEAGSIILMHNDPKDVVAGIQLARSTMNKIKQNLFWAFIYNIALIPIAAGLLYIISGVLLSPILAGAAMAMSSVTVVTNSLTLRRFRPRYDV